MYYNNDNMRSVYTTCDIIKSIGTLKKLEKKRFDNTTDFMFAYKNVVSSKIF